MLVLQRGESFEEIEEERKSSSHDRFPLRRSLGFESKHDSETVSYTHLTLPTKLEV